MSASDYDIEKLESLIEINKLINSDITDRKGLLTRILESAASLTEGEAASLLLVNSENSKLYFEIALGDKGSEVEKHSVNIGEGIAGWVAKHNKGAIVNDVNEDPRFSGSTDKKVGFTTQKILAVPMRIKDRCVGVIEIINKINGNVFTNDDLKWLEIFATQAAIAYVNAESYSKAKDEIANLNNQITEQKGFHSFIYASPATENLLNQTVKIANAESPVLIQGESGSGKELFAEQVHLNSPRKNQPLIRINCAALPEGLLESELFGHVKGAFTDATSDRRGRFELADGGSIFLDEIGEIPLAVQAKLLRVIQHQTFERVGSSEPIKVNVRIIAATNKDLEQEVQNGTFREDLFYRLNVFTIHVLPLRERIEDIHELAQHFIKRYSRELNKQIEGFSSEAINELLSYPWPGNVRELENAIERAVVLTDDTYIHPEHLYLQNYSENDHYTKKSFKEAMNIFKKQFIMKSLEQNKWNQTVTAEKLGIQRTYLSKLLRDLDITR